MLSWSSVLIINIFVSTAQEQGKIYPSQSYDTSLSLAPNTASPPAQQDLGAPRKNGTQEHSVVNFTTETSDTVTIHTGRAMKNPY